MKKMTTLCASLLLALGCLTANAMDSQTLVSNPGRYRVISTSPDGIAYADSYEDNSHWFFGSDDTSKFERRERP